MSADTSAARVIGTVFGVNLVLVGLAVLAADLAGHLPGLTMLPLALSLLASGTVTLALVRITSRHGGTRAAGATFDLKP